MIQDMSDCLDSLAVITVMGDFWKYTEPRKYIEAPILWYFGNGHLKRSKDVASWKADENTNLSAKDRLRWSKVSEWLDKYQRQNPAKDITWSRPEGDRLWDMLDGLDADMPCRDTDMLLAHVSDFPRTWALHISMYGDAWDSATIFILENKLFLTILVVLSLVYGGIHVLAWNFGFASEPEHLLWKFACIDTMATVPIALLCMLGVDFVLELDIFTRNLYGDLDTRYEVVVRALFCALAVFYVPSRIYVVVEAFISLRHVPIGAYAAVPWVQAVPHI